MERKARRKCIVQQPAVRRAESGKLWSRGEELPCTLYNLQAGKRVRVYLSADIEVVESVIS